MLDTKYPLSDGIELLHVVVVIVPLEVAHHPLVVEGSLFDLQVPGLLCLLFALTVPDLWLLWL